MAAYSVQATGSPAAPASTLARAQGDYSAFVLAFAALTATLGALVLLGWIFDVTLLKSGLPGHSATQPWAAVCFMLCGLALGLGRTPHGYSGLLMRAAAVAVLLVVLLNFCQNALDTDWGLDRLLFADAVEHEQPGQYLRAGRPAAATLIALALGSCCLLLVRARSPFARKLYLGMATAGALFAVTVLLAYAFSLHAIYAMGLYAQVSLTSGFCLAVMFAGVLMRRPDLGWMSLLTSNTVGAVSARRLLLWSVSLLIVLAAIVQIGSSRALYGAELDITLITVASIALLFAGLLTHARRLNDLERSRRGVANELRAAEAELNRADRHKDEFLAILAHELRNPLAPLRNGIEIVRQMAASDRALSRTIDMMTRQMNHLVRLVDDLLDVSRITHGALELRRRRISMQDVLERAVESCRPFIEAFGHQLVITGSDDQVIVDGDPDRLAQVVSNLLSNSAKYTDRGGHIEVNLTRQRGEAVVTVSDTGIGIAPAALEHIFEMFSSVHADGRRSDGGLGIGLALARSLTQMHGGKLTAQSAGPRTGSTFTLRVPAIQPDAKDDSPLDHAFPAQRSRETHRLRILVADDNADAAASLALLLELKGHHVQTAADGRKAIELAELFRPDIVFMDMGMPILDGAEAARQIRTHPWGRRMRIVALTGWGQEAERRRTEAAGIDLHLVKPVDPGALSAILMPGAPP